MGGVGEGGGVREEGRREEKQGGGGISGRRGRRCRGGGEGGWEQDDAGNRASKEQFQQIPKGISDAFEMRHFQTACLGFFSLSQEVKDEMFSCEHNDISKARS